MERDNYRRLPQYIAALAAAGGALASGTVLGWTSPTQNQIESGHYGFPVSVDHFSWVGSITNIGAALSCIPIGMLCQKFGRKLTMLAMVLPFILGWALIIWANSVGTLIAGRFFLGIAAGAFCVAAPMYTGEIASKQIRGILGTFFQLMITIGILFVYAVGSGVSAFTLSIICGIIPLVFGVVFVFMPESPLYLVTKGQSDKAVDSIKWLRGSKYDANAEVAELNKEHEERTSDKQASLWKALRRPDSLQAMGIGLGLMFFQQTSGINAVIFFTTDIFRDANTDIKPEMATIIIGVMQVIATVVAVMVVDRLGRRILLLSSGLMMALCTLALGVYFYLKDQSAEKVASLGWLPILSLCVFIIMFSFGFGPVPWLMMGELFAQDIKGFAAALAGTTNWLLSFLITKTFNSLRLSLGSGGTFWLFSGLTLLGTVFVFMFLPETKGRSLAEIQGLMTGGRRRTNEPRQVAAAASATPHDNQAYQVNGNE